MGENQIFVDTDSSNRCAGAMLSHGLASEEVHSISYSSGQLALHKMGDDGRASLHHNMVSRPCYTPGMPQVTHRRDIAVISVYYSDITHISRFVQCRLTSTELPNGQEGSASCNSRSREVADESCCCKPQGYHRSSSSG